MFKWTPEAAIGAIALGISTAGSLTVTGIHWGVSNAQITQLEAGQTLTQQKLDQHQAELSTQAAHNAAVEQKLDDVISRLDRMEKKL